MELCVSVNILFSKWQVQLTIRQQRSQMWGLLIQIRQVVRLIYHICSNPPYRSHLDPPFLILVHNSTIIVEHKITSSRPISPCPEYECSLSKLYTDYPIHWVLHPANTACTNCVTLPLIVTFTSWHHIESSASSMPPLWSSDITWLSMQDWR